jgi:hypothetical protein
MYVSVCSADSKAMPENMLTQSRMQYHLGIGGSSLITYLVACRRNKLLANDYLNVSSISTSAWRQAACRCSGYQRRWQLGAENIGNVAASSAAAWRGENKAWLTSIFWRNG